MIDEIKIGDRVKDVCGDVGEVIDIEYTDSGEVWRYILEESRMRKDTLGLLILIILARWYKKNKRHPLSIRNILCNH